MISNRRLGEILDLLNGYVPDPDRDDANLFQDVVSQLPEYDSAKTAELGDASDTQYVLCDGTVVYWTFGGRDALEGWFVHSVRYDALIRMREEDQ